MATQKTAAEKAAAEKAAAEKAAEEKAAAEKAAEEKAAAEKAAEEKAAAEKAAASGKTLVRLVNVGISDDERKYLKDGGIVTKFGLPVSIKTVAVDGEDFEVYVAEMENDARLEAALKAGRVKKITKG